MRIPTESNDEVQNPHHSASGLICAWFTCLAHVSGTLNAFFVSSEHVERWTPRTCCRRASLRANAREAIWVPEQADTRWTAKWAREWTGSEQKMHCKELFMVHSSSMQTHSVMWKPCTPASCRFQSEAFLKLRRHMVHWYVPVISLSLAFFGAEDSDPVPCCACQKRSCFLPLRFCARRL